MKIGVIGTGGAGIEAIRKVLPNHEIIQIEESEVNLVQPSDFAIPIALTNPYKEEYPEYIEGEFKKHRKGGNNRKKTKRKKARNGR
jgi:hypothetical protein